MKQLLEWVKLTKENLPAESVIVKWQQPAWNLEVRNATPDLLLYWLDLPGMADIYMLKEHVGKPLKIEYQVTAISINGRKWRIGSRVKDSWGQCGNVISFDELNDGWSVSVDMDIADDTLYNIKQLTLLDK